MVKALLTTLLCFLVLTSCSQQDTSNIQIDNTQTKQQRLQQTFDDIVTSANFMGSVAIMHSGEVIFSDSAGFDDIEQKTKSTSQSPYLIGSVSKTYTAALVLIAVEEQKLSLEQTIESFFPTLNNASTIRVKELLQHRSGIVNYTQRGKGFFDYRTVMQNKENMLARIIDLGSDFAPNSQAKYSNSNYFLLALILESVYQKSFDDILSEKITTPLGLTHTAQAIDQQINQHSYSFVDGKWTQFPASHLSTGFGAGAIKATPTEVATFYNALFTGKLISKPLVDSMTQIEAGFGLGITPIDYFDKQGYGHGGTFDAYHAIAAHFPSEKMTLVLTSNGSNDNFHEIYQQLLKSYFNQTLTDIPLTAEDLERYSGLYQASPEDKYAVKLVALDGKLANQFPDGYTQALRYEGDGRFVYDQVNAAPVYFILSDSGNQLATRLGDDGTEEIKFKVTQ